jgi:prepilin-type processing-associated H-X9-DG protein
MIVSEQSDWCIGASGETVDCRSDFWHGFITGTHPSSERYWNCTTVRYPINSNSMSQTGVGPSEYTYGCNRPLLSAHSGGAQALFGDGSVAFLQDSTDVHVLWRLADRDDGEAVGTY